MSMLPDAQTAPRFDIYAGIHKALRTLMSDTLVRLGRCDLDHSADLNETLERVSLMLSLLASHIDSENQVIHTAIEARQPQAARQTTDEHLEHQSHLAALHADVHSLRHASPEHRASIAQALYRHLALFVAKNLEHMHVEETLNNATLWSLFSDEEIAQLEAQIIARLGPDKAAAYLRWFAVSLSTAELSGFLLGMQRGAPVEVYEANLSLIRSELDAARRDRLDTALHAATAA